MAFRVPTDLFDGGQKRLRVLGSGRGFILFAHLGRLLCGDLAGRAGQQRLKIGRAVIPWSVQNLSLIHICIPAERLERLFRLRPLIHLNAGEALTVTGCSNLHRAVKSLCAATRGRVVVTLGARGVICAEGETIIEVPGRPAKVQDLSLLHI